MKKLLRAIVYVGTLAVLFATAVSVSGCRTADCSSSDTAEFPAIERWWK